MYFGVNILKYKEELLHDLGELMKIRSVYSLDPKKAEEALDYMLRRADEMGFVTKKGTEDCMAEESWMIKDLRWSLCIV